jgi:hypothetical protein
MFCAQCAQNMYIHSSGERRRREVTENAVALALACSRREALPGEYLFDGCVHLLTLPSRPHRKEDTDPVHLHQLRLVVLPD